MQAGFASRINHKAHLKDKSKINRKLFGDEAGGSTIQ
jgi:hypothetical protein